MALWPSFFKSLREYASRPLSYLRGPQFVYIWAIYGGTYLAANTVETVCGLTQTDPALPKWLATSSTNTLTCIAKDRAFAQMFGTSVPSNVPMGAYAAWLSRDFLSMGVFFTLPPLVGAKLAPYMQSEEQATNAAQVVLPLAVQFISTPLHLLGYDVYNNPKNSVAQRFTFLQKDYLKNVSIRMVRMAPPWSFGTIANRNVRTELLSKFGLKPLVATTPVYHLSG